ncbi:hypothetical protein [Streptomyces sp. NPDC005322]
MLDVVMFVALVITATGLPLGIWSRIRWPRRRADRQLLRLIRTSTRRTAR